MFKGCLPQILLGSFLNASHHMHNTILVLHERSQQKMTNPLIESFTNPTLKRPNNAKDVQNWYATNPKVFQLYETLCAIWYHLYNLKT